MQRTGASRSAQQQTRRHRRLAPVADLYVRRLRWGSVWALARRWLTGRHRRRFGERFLLWGFVRQMGRQSLESHFRVPVVEAVT